MISRQLSGTLRNFMACSADLLWRRNMDLNISLASGVEGICHLIPNFQFLAACCQNPTDEYIYIMNILQLVSELFGVYGV